jgi:hypothetical protein
MTTITKIETEKIHPNSWNPFSMSPQQLDNLVQDIRRSGVEHPISVRACGCDLIPGQHYEIVDGEQRFTAATDRRLDFQELECSVLELDDVQARIRTVNLNMLKGEVIPERFQNLVRELELKYSVSRETIASGFYMKLEELSMKLETPQIKPRLPKMKLDAKVTVYSVNARLHSREEYEFVHGILNQIMENSECDEGSALYSVFEGYKKCEDSKGEA